MGLLLLQSLHAFAGTEAMASMPRLKSKRTFIIKSKVQGEDLKDQSGFGEKEPEVRMMNLMMVEGSGYEGMDMAQMSMGKMKDEQPMQMAQAETPAVKGPAVGRVIYQFDLKTKPNPVQSGSNEIVISISDLKTKAPKEALKMKAKVYMTSMDMGTDEPRVRETAPGQYQLKATFSMNGPWAVKIILPNQEKIFDFNVGKTKGK